MPAGVIRVNLHSYALWRLTVEAYDTRTNNHQSFLGILRAFSWVVTQNTLKHRRPKCSRAQPITTLHVKSSANDVASFVWIMDHLRWLFSHFSCLQKFPYALNRPSDCFMFHCLLYKRNRLDFSVVWPVTDAQKTSQLGNNIRAALKHVSWITLRSNTWWCHLLRP